MSQGCEPLHPAFGHAHDLPPDLSDVTTAQALRSWLHRCEQSHESCRAPVAKLPTRVLDLSAQIPRLVEFQAGGSPYGKYATMSHCWGDPRNGKPTRTTKQTIESRKAGIEPHDLSPLFRDAIQLCRMVNCDYLWIDSLCIVQDDLSDWKVESLKMAAIYSNAEFNIAATSSADSTDSMYQQRWSVGIDIDVLGYGAGQPVQTYELQASSATGNLVCVRKAQNQDHGFVQGGLTKSRREQAPLLDRAWVFQEVLLSRRTLHVCSSELIWECKTLCDCECGSLDSDGRHNLDYKQQLTKIRDLRSTVEDTYRFWLTICERYSALSLTHASDRTVALAGLVQAIQPATNGTYFAGVWKEDLARALIWRGFSPPSPDASRAGSALPTWSWMSRVLDGGHCTCLFPTITRGYRQEPSTSIVTADSRPASGEGEWRVIIEGPIITAAVCEEQTHDRRQFYAATTSLFKSIPRPERILLVADCPFSSNEPLCGGDTVKCLLLGTDEAGIVQYILVVQKCEGPDKDAYRRVGMLDLVVSPALHIFSNAQSERIRLV